MMGGQKSSLKNILLYVSLRRLKDRPLRSSLTLLGIAIGISLFTSIQLVNRSIQYGFKESIEASSGKAQLTVRLGNSPFDEVKIEEITAIEGVKSVAPRIEERVYYKKNLTDSNLVSLHVFGVDLLKESGVRSYATDDGDLLEDPLTFLNQPNSIILTQNFALKHQIEVDETLELSTARGKKSFLVRGLLKPEGPARAFGGAIAVMDIDGARYVFNKMGKVDVLDILLTPGAALQEVRTRIQNKLGPEFTVDTAATRGQSTENLLSAYQGMLSFFSTLALLVAVFLIYNSVSLTVAERRKEIGLLRAIGAGRIQVLFSFLSESLALGVVGAGLGIVSGRFLAEKLSGPIRLSVKAQTKLDPPDALLQLEPRDLLMGFAAGILTTVIATFWPAYQATKISPLVAIRQSHSWGEEEISRSRKILWSSLSVFVLAHIARIFGIAQWGVWVDTIVSGLILLSVALLTPSLVIELHRGLRSIVIGFTRRFPSVSISSFFSLIIESNLKHQVRVYGNLMTLSVGLFLVNQIGTTKVSFRDSVSDWVDSALVSDLSISLSGQLVMADVQPFDESLAQEIATTSGIRPAGDGRGYRARFRPLSSGGKSYFLKAFDPPPDFYNGGPIVTPDPKRRLIDGKALFGTMEPRILVSKTFLNSNPGTGVGKTFPLDTPSGRIDFMIVGEITDYASNVGVIYMNRNVYRNVFKDTNVDLLNVALAPGEPLETLRERLQEKFGTTTGLTLLSTQQMRNEIRKAVTNTFGYLDTIQVLALVISLFGFLNTVLMGVMERTREIGLYRSVGATRRQVLRLILGEALLQGSIGGLVAIGISTFACYVWMQTSLSQTLGWVVQFHGSVTSLLLTVGIAVLVAALGAYYPAYRASRISMKEAMDESA